MWMFPVTAHEREHEHQMIKVSNVAEVHKLAYKNSHGKNVWKATSRDRVGRGSNFLDPTQPNPQVKWPNSTRN